MIAKSTSPEALEKTIVGKGTYAPVLAQCDALTGNPVPPALSALVVSQVMVFEQPMVDELLDWIAITQNDVIELAP